jgi:hypothetical protein
MSELDIIDSQVLKLIDYLKDLHTKTQTNLNLTEDYAFGNRFYHNNKYIVKQMRSNEKKEGKNKRAPHLLIVNLGKHFNVDFNFFYDPNYKAEDAIGSEASISDTPKEESIEGVFREIDNRLTLFAQENNQPKDKEESKHYQEIINELGNIKTHLNKSFSQDSLSEKRTHIIEAFDRIILLSRKKIDTMTSKAHLEQDITKLAEQIKGFAENKTELERSIQKLNIDLGECNRMAFEAQKGQTEALKQLLATKNKN